MSEPREEEKQLGWVCDTTRGFQIIQILSTDSDRRTKVLPLQLRSSKRDAEPTEIPTRKVHTSPSGIHELAFIKRYTSDSILHALKWRYDHDEIYTNSGLFLLALNPFKRHKNLYAKDTILAYHLSPAKQLTEPHIFTVVERAYTNMKSHNTNQSILISGVSGSGKTETAKYCIRYLGEVAAGDDVLETRINAASPVLEAFGNAKTVTNPNSSRFGKFTRVYFDKTEYKMVGAEIQTYILEKSRVVFVPKQERNFHIFYQMIAGLTPEELQKLHIKSVNDFVFLKRGEDAVTEDINDARDFGTLKASMEVLKFSPEKQRKIWRILSGILHLGNIEFDEVEEKAIIVNEEELKIVADLLDFDQKELRDALTSVFIQSLNQTVPLNRNKAILSRDSLAKHLYELLFNWIVARINKVIGARSDFSNCNFIGILDISGYENLPENNFEQLCMNYTNDKLQQHFNVYVHEEQELYKRELGWEPVNYDKDLQHVIDSIEKEPNGLFHLMDKLCFAIELNDEELIHEIKLAHGSSQCYQFDEKNPLKFSLQHGPGRVVYTAKDMLLKNRDLLSKSLQELVTKSKSKLINKIFKSQFQQRDSLTVASSYLRQMFALGKVLEEGDTLYIKCIRPNTKNLPKLFDYHYVKDQIKWNGVVETLKLVQKGYPVHFKFSKFYARYKNLLSKKEQKEQKEHEKEEKKEDKELEKELKQFEKIADSGKRKSSTQLTDEVKIQFTEKLLKREEDKQDKLVSLCKSILTTHLQEGAYIISRNLIFLRFDGFFALELLNAAFNEEGDEESEATKRKEALTEIERYKKTLAWLIHYKSSNNTNQ